jgi:ergothioneine biosynthesis protein EgtB
MTTREIVSRFLEVRAATVRLADPLSPEDCLVQSMPDASPAKWHLAHTTWFFETFVLAPHAPGYVPYDERWGFLFNSYYESVGARQPRPERGLLSRPSLAEVLAYRRAVDESLAGALERGALNDPRVTGVIELGLNHEEQHQELLLTDIQHALFGNPLRPAYSTDRLQTPEAGPDKRWTEHDGGVVSIGRAGEGFSFDNEGPEHKVHLEPFAVAARRVTCGEFAEFVDDGGYRRPELWLSDGWSTVQARGWSAPLYWERGDVGWTRFSLYGMVPIDANAPVCHVSYYEADAFARWAGARLPTEAEWEVVARARPLRGQFAGDGLVPRPEAPSGLMGGTWTWTKSPYTEYPGFVAAPGALGEYNGKFMVNQLVLRGGSCFTPRGHVRPSYRNFFYPDARWQVSGIRLARKA